MKSRKFNITLTETTGETFRAMRNTVVYDRVLLFKNKFEEHLREDFDVLPMHFKQMKDLVNIELDRIAERLDFMMTEDEFFAGDPQKCTINAFVKNFNRFRSSGDTKSKLDEAKKARDMQKKQLELYYQCDKCGHNVKKTNRYNHEMYICQAVTQSIQPQRKDVL